MWKEFLRNRAMTIIKVGCSKFIRSTRMMCLQEAKILRRRSKGLHRKDPHQLLLLLQPTKRFCRKLRCLNSRLLKAKIPNNSRKLRESSRIKSIPLLLRPPNLLERMALLPQREKRVKAPHKLPAALAVKVNKRS